MSNSATASNQSGTPTTTSTTGVSSERFETLTRTADGAMADVTQTFGPGFDLQMEETVSLSADGRICRSGSRSSTARSPRTSPGSMASHTAQGLSRLPEKPMRRTCSFGFLKAMTPGSLRQAAACREAGCSGSVWRGPFMAIRFS